MQHNTFDLLETERKERMNSANERALHHEWWYKVLQRTIIGLSTGTGLFTGLAAFTDWPGCKVMAFVLSTITSGFLALLSTFKHQEKADQYDKLSTDLSIIRYQYDADLDPYAKAKSVEEKKRLYARELTRLFSHRQSRVMPRRRPDSSQ